MLQQPTQMTLLLKQLAGKQPAKETPSELQLHKCTPIYEQCPCTHGPQQRPHPQQLEGTRKWQLETRERTSHQRKCICPRIQKLLWMLQLQERRTLCTQLPPEEIHTLQWEETSQPHWLGGRRRTGLRNAGCPRTRFSGISLSPTGMHATWRPDASGKRNGSLTGFSLGIIRSALVRWINSNDVTGLEGW